MPTFHSVILAGVYDIKNLKLKIRPEEEHKYNSPWNIAAICKFLDEEISENERFENISDVWTEQGVAAAVKLLLSESTPLFDSMVKQLDIYKDLRDMIRTLLYQGEKIPASPNEEPIKLGYMFGFLKEDEGHVVMPKKL